MPEATGKALIIAFSRRGVCACSRRGGGARVSRCASSRCVLGGEEGPKTSQPIQLPLFIYTLVITALLRLEWAHSS
jgi:hypothetical protein